MPKSNSSRVRSLERRVLHFHMGLCQVHLGSLDASASLYAFGTDRLYIALFVISLYTFVLRKFSA